MQFLVEDLSCNHCVAQITKAIQNADPAAQVQIDIPSKTVNVTTTLAAPSITQTISDAGFTPALLAE
jgi:copper chaperone